MSPPFKIFLYATLRSTSIQKLASVFHKVV